MRTEPQPTNADDAKLAVSANPSDNPFSPAHHPDRSRATQSHRAVLILVLGVSSWFLFCPVLSVIAWVFGTADLFDMAAGKMDNSGRRWTSVGRTLGIVYTILWLLAAAVGMSMLMFAIAK